MRIPLPVSADTARADTYLTSNFKIQKVFQTNGLKICSDFQCNFAKSCTHYLRQEKKNMIKKGSGASCNSKNFMNEGHLIQDRVVQTQ